jgi:uncharacterized phage protein (TIGR02218 family)
MRTLDLGFKAHIESGATTLATCWNLLRTDGVVLGFTDHDLPLSFDGTDYAPNDGLDGGTVDGKLGAQVDTTEVVGVLSSDAIAEADIAIGRYDGATVETWRVNWRDVSQRLLLSRTTIGEIVREDGQFRAELRSGQQGLNQTRGRLYGALCDATFGDARCTVDVTAPAYSATATVVAVRDRNSLALSGLGGFAAGWFSLGRGSWTSGARAGLTDAVMSHVREGSTDILSFVQPVGDWVVAADTLTAIAGCDRAFATCRDRFANTVNFRGFPHIPGNDFVLTYPRSGDALDGAALFP